MKWIGIGILYALPFGYAAFLLLTDQPIEWGAIGFMVAMAVGITLYATVLKKYTEDTQENHDMAVEILKSAARGMARPHK